MTDVAARNKRNRRAGARWQSESRDGLRAYGMDIERLVLTGTQDEGDNVIRRPPIHVPEFLVLENKAGALHPAQHVREAELEAAHFAYHRGLDLRAVSGMVLAKRRGAGLLDAYVLTTVRTLFGLEPR